MAETDMELISSDRPVSNVYGPFGTLTKLPLEVRQIIYRYVLDLCSLPEEYLKGQKKDTGSKAICSGILTTSKDIYKATMEIVFKMNQFILVGYRIREFGSSNLDEPNISKYCKKLFLSKKEFGFFQNKGPHAFDPRQWDSTTGNEVDSTKISEGLLSQIQFLTCSGFAGLNEVLLETDVLEEQPKFAIENFQDMFNFIDRCIIKSS